MMKDYFLIPFYLVSGVGLGALLVVFVYYVLCELTWYTDLIKKAVTRRIEAKQRRKANAMNTQPQPPKNQGRRVTTNINNY